MSATGLADSAPLSREISIDGPRRRAARRRRVTISLARLFLLVLFFSVWEIGARIRTDADHFLIDPFLWSQPTRIAARLWQWLADGTIADNTFFTLYEAGMGFLIGLIGGVSAGFFLGRSDFWASVFQPFIQALNAIPRLVFAPLLFIVFGLGENSKIALGALVIFFICFWNAFQGVRDVDRNVFNNARLLGADGWQMTRHVLLPSATIWILSSLHIAVGFAMAAAIVGEYLGSFRGLGHIIARSEGNFDQTGVLAGLLFLSAVVVVVEIFVSLLERRLVRWKPKPAGDLGP